MELKKTIRIITLYGLAVLVASFAYIGLFWTDLFSNSNSLFFRAGALMLLTIGALFLFLQFARRLKIWWFKFFLIQDVLLVCLLFFCINWQVYGLVPFNATRSNSIILLDYLYFKNGNPVSSSEVEEYVKRLYFDEYKSVDVRLVEQEKSGNLKNIDGLWVITRKGRSVAVVMSFVTNLYNPNKSYFIHVGN